jgi:DNA-binding response OmpR family regulator
MTFLKKILLVDYEPRVTALVKRALEETGKYLIKEEHDSRLAVNSARWFQPDLILFDVNRHTIESNSIVRQLQEDPALQGTPVVFLCVNTADEGGVVSAGILSGYSFFANPIRVEEFVGYVAELFRVPAELVGSGYRVAS